MMRARLHAWFGDSRWIPWSFVAFFLVIFAADAVMVTLAVRSWTGLSTVNAYEKGLAFNEALLANRAQAELGWQGELSFAPKGRASGLLTLELHEQDGRPVQGDVIAHIRRPTSEGHDLTLPLVAHGSGLYTADLDLPLLGQWDVRVVASRGDDVFRLKERMFVQ